MMFEQSAIEWVKNNFANLSYTNIRRRIRIVNLASKMMSFPGQSIPQLCKNFYEIKAVYNCLGHAETTPDLLQKTHRDLVHKAMENAGEFLLIEDTSDISFTSKKNKIPGLGSIGNLGKKGQGFLLHSILAVKWDKKTYDSSKKPSVEVLGIVDQQYTIRKPASKKNGKREVRSKCSLDEAAVRESALWENRISKLPQPSVNKGIRYVRICDRAADIYEVLYESQKNGFGFVIRATQNRKLNGPLKLFDYAKLSPILGTFKLSLRARLDKPARIVELSISAKKVEILSPTRKGFPIGKLPSILCSIVRVWEANPPLGIKPLEWNLLCDQEIITLDQAINCTMQYACRWIIEDYHKVLKSGFNSEKLQLESAHKLFAAIAIMGVLALRLIDLRERFRIDSIKPAKESGLSKLELKILATYLKRKLKTVMDVNLALGKLGGHINRKSDGPPGMMCLWRGLIKLNNLLEGYKLGILCSS